MSDVLNKYDSISFKNLDDKEFAHAYDGDVYTVPAGATVNFPRFLAVHLAHHLARKICRKKFKGENGKTSDGRFNIAQIEEVKSKILAGGVVAQVSKPQPTAQERLRKEVDELNKSTGSDVKPNQATKKEVMEQLKALDVRYDENMTRAELLQLLEQYQPKSRPTGSGNDGDDDFEAEKPKTSDAANLELTGGKLQPSR